jgi:hypothetical protein
MENKIPEKKCRNLACKNSFKPFRSTDKFCSYKCDKEFNQQRKIDKERRNQEISTLIQKVKLNLKDTPEKKKSTADLEIEAKVAFQAWIRFRDENERCISCNKKYSEIWDGGHYLKAELYSGIIFHEHNCHKECRGCNFYKPDNSNYRENLIHKIGIQNVESLEKLAYETRYYKYSPDELISIKKKYELLLKKKIKTIEN